MLAISSITGIPAEISVKGTIHEQTRLAEPPFSGVAVCIIRHFDFFGLGFGLGLLGFGFGCELGIEPGPSGFFTPQLRQLIGQLRFFSGGLVGGVLGGGGFLGFLGFLCLLFLGLLAVLLGGLTLLLVALAYGGV